LLVTKGGNRYIYYILKSGLIVISEYKTNFPLILLFSFFIHAFLFVIILLPDRHRYDFMEEAGSGKSRSEGGRDIIVNINQDNLKERNRRTLLSDKDSSAKGYITRKRGERWLNNSLEFMKPGAGSQKKASRFVKSGKEKFILNSKSEIVIALQDKRAGVSDSDVKGSTNFAIPDKNDVTMKNAIYYSNSGMFSFNTSKFKNYRYFRKMKNRIASNWYTPVMANAVIRGYSGNTTINAIGNRKIKIIFYLNRSGDVIFQKTIQSSGMSELDESCEDAIRLSKNFGKLPGNIKGDTIMIPFIFGYYTR